MLGGQWPDQKENRIERKERAREKKDRERERDRERRLRSRDQSNRTDTNHLRLKKIYINKKQKKLIIESNKRI